MPRKLSHREWIHILLAQGSTLLCFRCHEPVLHEDDCEREHLRERELGGDDSADNARLSHVGCHAQVTHGTPATSAGSSRHRIAKANDPTRIDKFVPVKRPLDEPREPKRRWGR